VDGLIEEYGYAYTEKIPPEKMTLSKANEVIKVKMFLHYIKVQRIDTRTKIINFDANVFYSINYQSMKRR
jgi:hypothetical protein